VTNDSLNRSQNEPLFGRLASVESLAARSSRIDGWRKAIKNGCQRKRFPRILDEARAKGVLSRPPFLIVVLVTCARLVLLTAPSLESAEKPRSSVIAATSPASGGYSILNETMVDMTWPELEKAARQGAIVLLPTAVV